ncbi:hypothetical protein AYO44_12930 [Planctomycetaceae bacterium SCGC AG-212-F19]|nr:hypothetical protein AYO44_12930 [Planctomycetaceae bacterium SCGC AG-212-F19]
MRHVPFELGLGALLVLAGCNSFPLSRGSNPPQAARVPAEVPNKEAVIAYLNENADRVESIRCKSLDITAKQGFQSVSLPNSQMTCAKPRSFRLMASVFGKPEVDVGSNDHEFWFWMARDESHRLYFCSYEDLAQRQVPMPFPFQPEWITEAMGIAKCGPPENYDLQVKQSTLELIEKTRSPQGVPVRKVTVFNRARATGTQPQVTAHLLQDAQGHEIVSAYITEVQIDRTTGAIIPRKVRLVCPADKLELKLQLDDVSVNDPTVGQAAPRLFARPALANATLFDLARGPDPASVRRIGHQRPQ